MVVRGLTFVVALLASGALARPLGAQSRYLIGRVVDTAGAALGEAQVSVDGTYWRATTRRDGSFTLVLARGPATIRVQRIGYVPAAIAVTWPEDTVRLPLVVTLRAASAALPGVTIRGETAPAVSQTISRESMQRLPALGEADVFRALPLLPSVSMYDDVLGRVQLAGGASDEHGVRLNGHPMEAPFHLYNIFGAFNVASLDRADVLMHHLPADVDGRLSGLIDVRTRRPSADGAGEGTLSLLASSVTVEKPDVAGVDVLASARITYVDRVLSEWASRTSSDKDLFAPGYRDGVLTLARTWNRVRGEMTLYGTRDHLWFRDGQGQDEPDAEVGRTYGAPRWGGYLVGLHVARDGARWTPSLRLSANVVDAAGWQDETEVDAGDSAPFHPPFEGAKLGQRWLSAGAELRRDAQRWSLRGGIGVDRRAFEYEWYGSLARTLLNEGVPLAYRARSGQTVGGAFVEGARVIAGWELTGGTRVSLLDGRPLVAPRLLASRRLSRALRVDAAVNRRHQWDVMGRTPELGSTVQPVYPLRRARVVDAGALTASWRSAPSATGRRGGVDAALYARRYGARTLVDSAGNDRMLAAPLGFDEFPRVRRTVGRTRGASLAGGIALANGLSFRGSYTLQSARERDGDRWVATDWDAPQQLALAALAPLGRGWSLSSALQMRSGVPTTPIALRVFTPSGPEFYPRYVFGARNSARLDAYRRLDVGVRRGWRSWGADWVLSLQAVNVLRDVNALRFDWERYFGCQLGECYDGYADQRGLPLLPSIGLEVKW